MPHPWHDFFGDGIVAAFPGSFADGAGTGAKQVSETAENIGEDAGEEIAQTAGDLAVQQVMERLQDFVKQEMSGGLKVHV